MLQIDHHFSTFLVTNMTIEKLLKVATTHVDASFQAKWLWWWNLPTEVKTSAQPLREKDLDDSLKFIYGHM
jgi:hypothetical protein